MIEHESEDLSREKEPKQRIHKVSKTPTTFHIKLTDEQKEAKAVALENKIIFFTGKAGTAKTMLTCQIALDLKIRGIVDKIICTRPTVNVGDEELGFLPGDAFDFKSGKMAPYVIPILDAMYELRQKSEIDNMIEKKEIEILPVPFVRGRNFKRCIVIVDESQNLTYNELSALTTRLCPGSKMIFTSDLAQVDLIRYNESAGHLIEKIIKLEGATSFELTTRFRDPLANAIGDLIEEEMRERQKLKLSKVA